MRSSNQQKRRTNRHQLCSLAACSLIFIGAGCGRKAPPRPPEDVVPKTIADLSATNVAAGIQLSWSRPRVYADGTRMTDLGGFEVQRAGGGQAALAFQRIAVVEVNDRDRFRQIKRFRYLDPNTTVERQYLYRVVSFTLDRYFSEPSNVVTVERTITAEEKHAPLPGTQR